MIENGNYSIVSWESADTCLKGTVGSSITKLDKISNVLGGKVLTNLNGWESMSDVDILESININQYVFTELYIITELSYLDKGGIFKVSRDELCYFIKGYFEKYHECIFNGDVVIIMPEINLLVLFQHNGLFVSYDLPVFIK